MSDGKATLLFIHLCLQYKSHFTLQVKGQWVRGHRHTHHTKRIYVYYDQLNYILKGIICEKHHIRENLSKWDTNLD